MKTRIEYLRKGTIRLFTLQSLLFILLITPSFAQSAKIKPDKDTYIGIEGGLGVRSFTLQSDISQINKLTAVKGGYSLGVIYGTQTFKFSAVMGLYYAAIEEKRTIDLFTWQAGLNTSLISLIGIKNFPIDVYTITSVELQSFSFLGNYISLPDDQKRRKIYGETVLGKKRLYNANVGIGIEAKLREDYEFVHVFIEAKKPILIGNGGTSAFYKTNIFNSLAFNIGVRFGTVR